MKKMVLLLALLICGTTFVHANDNPPAEGEQSLVQWKLNMYGDNWFARPGCTAYTNITYTGANGVVTDRFETNFFSHTINVVPGTRVSVSFSWSAGGQVISFRMEQSPSWNQELPHQADPFVHSIWFDPYVTMNNSTLFYIDVVE